MLLKSFLSVFLILHGLVHLLYMGQSLRYFELQPGMVWPDNSWTLSRLFDDNILRILASILCLVIAIGFMISGGALLANQVWWRSLMIAVAGLSSVIFLIFWDGQLQQLDNQGWVGIVFNIALVLVSLTL